MSLVIYLARLNKLLAQLFQLMKLREKCNLVYISGRSNERERVMNV